MQIKNVAHLYFLLNNGFLRKLPPPIVALSFRLSSELFLQTVRITWPQHSCIIPIRSFESNRTGLLWAVVHPEEVSARWNETDVSIFGGSLGKIKWVQSWQETWVHLICQETLLPSGSFPSVSLACSYGFVISLILIGLLAWLWWSTLIKIVSDCCWWTVAQL